MKNRTFVVGMVLSLAGQSLVAQSTAFVETSISGAMNSPFPTIRGNRKHNFFFGAVRKAWTFSREDDVSLAYVAEVIPIAISTNNTVGYDTLSCSDPPLPCRRLLPHGKAAVGVGVTPLGLRLASYISKRASFGLEATGGAMVFTVPFPDPRARRFNFTASFGGDLQLGVGPRYGLSVGVVRHHVSNAGTARVNPGVNSWMVRFGFVRTMLRDKDNDS